MPAKSEPAYLHISEHKVKNHVAHLWRIVRKPLKRSRFCRPVTPEVAGSSPVARAITKSIT